MMPDTNNKLGGSSHTLNEIESPAFRRAALESERLRIQVLLAVLTAVILWVLVRAAWLASETEKQLLPSLLLGGLIFIAYEVGRWVFLSRWLRTGCEAPWWFWLANLAVEAAFPTWILFELTGSAFWGPYRALVAPAILLYFLFIILSTLRLNPGLCVLTGLFSALGYAAVLAHTWARYPEPSEASGAFPISIYASYSVLFFLGGLAAGGVAQRIRVHVLAALREAETRRQMDQIKNDLRVARTIQKGLLPKQSPDLPGYEIAGWSQPAEETGGDYYDWQPLPDGRLAVSLADVSGHGIGPALVTAACRAYSRASVPNGGALPALMNRINMLLVEDLPDNRFVTFAIVVLDPPSGRLELLSAGHGPIVIYNSAEDRLYDFPAQGIPFGITSTFDYGEALTMNLSPGDFVVLLTDGFHEWAGPGDEQFSLERVRQAIRAAKDLPAQELIAHLYAQARAFAQGINQQDDLTAVVIKRATPQP